MTTMSSSSMLLRLLQIEVQDEGTNHDDEDDETMMNRTPIGTFVWYIMSALVWMGVLWQVYKQRDGQQSDDSNDIGNEFHAGGGWTRSRTTAVVDEVDNEEKQAERMKQAEAFVQKLLQRLTKDQTIMTVQASDLISSSEYFSRLQTTTTAETTISTQERIEEKNECNKIDNNGGSDGDNDIETGNSHNDKNNNTQRKDNETDDTVDEGIEEDDPARNDDVVIVMESSSSWSNNDTTPTTIMVGTTIMSNSFDMETHKQDEEACSSESSPQEGEDITTGATSEDIQNNDDDDDDNNNMVIVERQSNGTPPTLMVGRTTKSPSFTSTDLDQWCRLEEQDDTTPGVPSFDEGGIPTEKGREFLSLRCRGCCASSSSCSGTTTTMTTNHHNKDSDNDTLQEEGDVSSSHGTVTAPPAVGVVVAVPNGCAICLDTYDIGETVVWSSKPCHAFHQDCLLDYAKVVKFNRLSKRRNKQEDDDEDSLLLLCPCCRQEFFPSPPKSKRKRKPRGPSGLVAITSETVLLEL